LRPGTLQFLLKIPVAQIINVVHKYNIIEFTSTCRPFYCRKQQIPS
jgi:hypothetical protein